MNHLEKTSSSDLIVLLTVAADLIFAKKTLPEFLTYRLRSNTTSSLRPSPQELQWHKRYPAQDTPSSQQWAANMAELITKSKGFGKLLENCIQELHSFLRDNDPTALYVQYSNEPEADYPVDLLKFGKARVALVANPHHPSWLVLVLFAFSRVLAQSSNKVIRKQAWSEADVNCLASENALCYGNQKLLGRLMVEHLSVTEFHQVLGHNGGMAFAEMATRNIDSPFFTELAELADKGPST